MHTQDIDIIFIYIENIHCIFRKVNVNISNFLNVERCTYSLNYQTFQPEGLLRSVQKSSNLSRDIHIHMQVITYYVFLYISDFSTGGVAVSFYYMDRERET